MPPPKRPPPPKWPEPRITKLGFGPERNRGNSCARCVFMVRAWLGFANRCIGPNMGNRLRAWDAPRCNLYEPR